MNSKEFTKSALVTEAKIDELPINLGGLYRVLRVLTTASQLADTVKRAIYYGKGLDTDRLAVNISTLRDEVFLLGLYQGQLADAGMPTDDHLPNLRVLHGSIGMFGEAGELLEAVMKQIKTGELDLVNVGEETADSDWYKAILHDETGVLEETARAAVISKLKVRYPGKFDSDSSGKRDLAGERAAMESVMGVVVK